MPSQEELLKKRPHILVATPGRLLDLLDSGATTLSQVRCLGGHLLATNYNPAAWAAAGVHFMPRVLQAGGSGQQRSVLCSYICICNSSRQKLVSLRLPMVRCATWCWTRRTRC